MAAPHLTLSERKASLRLQAMAVRADCDPVLGALLARHVLSEFPPAPAQIVAGFWPMPGEIDIRPLLEALDARGHPVLLPVTPARGQPLVFRRWRPGAAMRPGRFGTQYPEGDADIPDMLLVPLLAFDAAGHRLGYGGGYYDRTLAALPGRRTLGCAFAAQQVPAIPAEPDDIALDAVATEKGIMRVAG